MKNIPENTQESAIEDHKGHSLSAGGQAGVYTRL